MVKLIEELTVNEYDDSHLNQILTKCGNCETDICYFTAMFKYNRSWCIEQFGLFRGKWHYRQTLCYKCNETIGCLINFERFEVVKFYYDKVYFWHNS